MEPAESPRFYETGGFRIDVAQRLLLAADGARVPLPSRAFELLLCFVRRPGELLDKNRLMSAVWPNTVVEENNLTQSVGALRKALGEAPGEHRFLVTEPGRGYRFVAPVRAIGPQSPQAPAQPRRRWPLVAALLVVGAVLGGVVALLQPDRAGARASGAGPGSLPTHSIAVLPFESRSAAREDEYLALGIQDELLTLLTRVSGLRVASRTSTSKYAAGPAEMPRIGRELGVTYLLSGSVQRAGGLVRVNVALIEAAADRQIWAQTFERGAADVFAVESEVALAVAGALQARLTAQERREITSPPTENPAAYDAYLRARAFAEKTTRTEAEIRAAIAAYETAVRLDPGFAPAWAQLARRHANFFSLAYDRSPRRREAARHALAEATRLAPDAVETEAARLYFLFVVEGDLEGAERDMRAFESRAPQSADAAAGLAQVTRELGQMDRSADYARRVLALDPLNPYRHSIVCHDYLTARQLDLALSTCERALELLPGDAGTLTLEATLYQARGDLERARTLLRPLTPAPGDWRTLRAMSRQHLLDREPAAAVALLGKYLADPAALGTRLGMVRRWLADARRLSADASGARAEYRRARAELEAELALQERNPVLLAELAIVRARLDDRDAVLEQRCMAYAVRPKRDAMMADCMLARIQAELAAGSAADAVALLAAAATTGGFLPPLTPELLRLDPDYDALRSRADFQALLPAPVPGMAESTPK